MDAVTDGKQKKTKFPVRIGAGLLIGCLGWLIPYCGLAITLLPARIQAVDPVHKVALVATFSAVAMAVAAISNIINGSLSDRTRSRFGKRTPFIVGGTLATVVLFYLISISTSIKLMLLFYALYQIALNAVVASLVAVIPDRIAPEHRGTASSWIGLGSTIGNFGAGLIASHFIIHVQIGIWTFAALAVVMEAIAIILIKEPGNKDEPRNEVKGFGQFLDDFAIPLHGVHDFYLALFGRLALTAGYNMIIGYQLYILTDYMNLSSSPTTKYISLISAIMLVLGIVCGVTAGPIADKVGNYKIPVALCMAIMGVGAFVPFIAAQPWTMLVFAVLSGIGNGAFNAVDQALIISVLPDDKTAAKDMGILNLSNTLGQIVGPIMAGAIISASGYHFLFPVVTVICMFGGVLIMMIHRSK